MTNLTQNILDVYAKATPKENLDGMVWYAEAKSDAQLIADATELPLHVVVGVVSALSPTNNWNQNLKDAHLFCQTFVDGGYFEEVKASTYKTMWQKAWDILVAGAGGADANDVAVILNGPKITDFFWCILGDESQCVIDGHAWGIAYADRRVMQEVPNIGKKLRAELKAAYADAAKQSGIAAYQMQAITWVAWRRIHGIK